MKKLAILSLIFTLCPIDLDAQNVLRGKVTDKQGNPIAGAKVENAKGAGQTTTDMNGAFELETEVEVEKVSVYYTGMNLTRKKAEQDMLIVMGRKTWWTEEPTKYSWLVGFEMVAPDDDFKPAFGAMVGRVKNIGWYAKGVYRKAESTDDVIYSEYGSDAWMTGKTKSGYWSLVGGVMVRLKCPIYFYFGMGYVDRTVAWEGVNGDYYEYAGDSYDGGAIDTGLLITTKYVYINCGLQACFTGSDEVDAFDAISANIGIGVYF